MVGAALSLCEGKVDGFGMGVPNNIRNELSPIGHLKRRGIRSCCADLSIGVRSNAARKGICVCAILRTPHNYRSACQSSHALSIDIRCDVARFFAPFTNKGSEIAFIPLFGRKNLLPEIREQATCVGLATNVDAQTFTPLSPRLGGKSGAYIDTHHEIAFSGHFERRNLLLDFKQQGQCGNRATADAVATGSP